MTTCFRCNKELTSFIVRKQEWFIMALDDSEKLRKAPGNRLCRPSYSFRGPNCGVYHHYSEKQAKKTLMKQKNRKFKTEW